MLCNGTLSFRGGNTRVSKPIHPALAMPWCPSTVAAVEQWPDGAIVADVDGRLVWCNPAAHALLGGVRLGAIIADYSCMHRLFTLDERPFPADDLPLARAVLHEETCHDVALKVRRADGRWTVLTVAAQPLHGTHAEPLGGIVLFRAA